MESQKTFIIRSFIFLLGFIAMSAQITIIREALAIFNGNELVIGLCLGLWMLLTAAGAFIGTLLRVPRAGEQISGNGPFFLFLFLIIIPFFMPLGMAYIKNQLLPAGVMAGIWQIGIIMLATLAPFCLLSGLLFPLLANRLSAIKSQNLIHTSYGLDSGGSILAGILFSVLIFALPQAPGHKPHDAEQNHPSSIFSFQTARDRLLYPGQEVLETRQTPFGKLTVTRMMEQLNLYENGNPVLMEKDPAQREEPVHYAMLLHPEPGRVLMISGGTGGGIDEALKYPGVRVDFIETNPFLIEIAEKYAALQGDDRLRIIVKDPRLFLINKDDKYDVILVNAPDPGSAEMNRFFTMEFFQLLRQHLNPGGIVSLSIPAAGNYMNETSRALHSVLYTTLSRVFSNIRIIPGNRDYYLASDANLAGSLWRNKNRDSVPTVYVNRGYIDETLLQARSNVILESIDTSARPNTDLRPYVYFQTYRLWLDQYKVDSWILPASLIVLVILAFIMFRPVTLGLFSAGFTAASLEFLLIIWFQAVYGVVYQVTGLIFATFMAGMTIGSFLMPRLFRSINGEEFIKMQAIFFILPLVIAPLMLLMPYGLASWIKIAVIFLLVMVTGLLMGIIFALSGVLQGSPVIKSSGRAFSADLSGSALGILLTSVYLIPVFGLPVTAMMLGGMNALALLLFKYRE